MTTNAERLAALMVDIYANPEEDHLDILARHVSASSIERAREADRRVIAQMVEDGYPAPVEDDIS